MGNLGIIDIGSNSIRLLLVEINKDTFKVIDEIKELARLGGDMGEEKTLKKDHLDIAYNSLKLFKIICDSKNIKTIIATATEAIRKAENGSELVKKIKDELGLDIRILNGQEEAFYDYVAVTNSLNIENSIIMDVGGCSTEIIWNEGKKIIISTSIPIGTLNITEKFDLYNGIKDEKQGEVKKFIYGVLTDVDWLFNINCNRLVGVGGTFRNIGSIDAARKGIKTSSSSSLHGYKLISKDIKSIYNQIRGMSVSEKKDIKGLSLDRADIFTGGLYLINAFIDFCGMDEIILSKYGLREGLVYEYINKIE